MRKLQVPPQEPGHVLALGIVDGDNEVYGCSRREASPKLLTPVTARSSAVQCVHVHHEMLASPLLDCAQRAYYPVGACRLDRVFRLYCAHRSGRILIEGNGMSGSVCESGRHLTARKRLS